MRTINHDLLLAACLIEAKPSTMAVAEKARRSLPSLDAIENMDWLAIVMGRMLLTRFITHYCLCHSPTGSKFETHPVIQGTRHLFAPV